MTKVLGCLRGTRGFSVAETATLLTALSVFTAIASPTVEGYIEQARLVKATHDARVIAVVLVRMTDDVSGSGRKLRGWATYDLLVSDGETPQLGLGGDPAWVAPAGTRVGFLREHLVINGAGYPPPLSSKVPMFSHGWRGPYVEAAVGPDPWAHRYAVNVRLLAAGGASDTVVMSAGPNGLVETAFEADGIAPGGDDILALVSSGR